VDFLRISVEAALHQEYYVLLITERISRASDTNSVTVNLYDDGDEFVIVMMMMMMMCDDLMCTKKLTRSQFSLTHNAIVTTDMTCPRKQGKNSWSPWSQSSKWKGRRTMKNRICGKDEF